MLKDYNAVLSDTPGHTKTVVHSIKLRTTAPIRSSVYPVHLREIFDSEVEKLLELGIIRRSKFRFPVVLVKKSDGSHRLTVDFRMLNRFSEFDAEPAFNPDEDLHKFVVCKYFSEIDMTKAYHRVELDDESRPLTAFPTSKGLMEYTRLPFGLVTACATYARLMRIVLSGINGVTFYFDNVLIYSKSWDEHLNTLIKVFEALKRHGLTAKPNKCNFGFSCVNYLGFLVWGDELAPRKAKIDAMSNVVPPTTRKGLRSFLGLISFYRRFLPNLASLTAPLTGMLKKDTKEPMLYEKHQIECFDAISSALTSRPILKLPDLSKPFVVRSDSSGVAVGAMLLQYHDDMPFPVAYASRKLTPSERNFSTVERECLAIIFSVHKFSVFLLGKPFILEEDHRPLVYLSKMKNLNSRLARWALCLQPHDYSLVYLPGVENVGADYLSRSS